MADPEHIRDVTEADIDGLYRIAAELNKRHENKYFERGLLEQREKRRVILAADKNGRLVAYGQLIWSPVYAPFKRLDIPEIQDLNVIPAARREGIGGRMIDAFETLAQKMKKTDIGIAVGLDVSYAAAQRLYV